VPREGTNISVALSPDGRWLAMDLVTAIWVLPATGGTARRLTGDLQDATLPSWSPDGRSIVFQSYRDGNFHLHVVDVDGGEPRQLTRGRFDHREPAFSPDGRRIAFTSDRGGSYGVWLLDVASGEVTALTGPPDEAAAPRWSRDGERIVVTVNETAVDVITVATAERTRVATAPTGGRIHGATFGPDGRTPSYTLVRGGRADLVHGDRQLTTGEDVFGFAATWIGRSVLYTADGAIRRREPDGAVRDVRFQATVPIARRTPRHPPARWRAARSGASRARSCRRTGGRSRSAPSTPSTSSRSRAAGRASSSTARSSTPTRTSRRTAGPLCTPATGKAFPR
jgi:dipeptidyl aminopeptidase/acylaminoacyl peptidase